MISNQIPHIVTIGGGTGQFYLLNGLKHHPVHLSAVVTVADSGGDSGNKRIEYGILPPGDLRQALVALSHNPGKLLDHMNYRFTEGSLRGYNFGNLWFMAALGAADNDVEQAINDMRAIYHIEGDVLPVSFDDIQLKATLSDGTVIVGEHKIDKPEHDGCLRIAQLELVPPAKLNPRVAQALLAADLIVIGPGDIHTSILPDIITDGMTEAMDQSTAPIVYVANLVTKWGQTNGMTAADHVGEINRYLGRRKVDTMIFNTGRPPDNLIERYHHEREELVVLGEPPCRVERHNLLSHGEIKKVKGDLIRRSYIRHDSTKLAHAVMRELHAAVLRA